MLDDMMCDASDLNELKEICESNKLAKCWYCQHVSPNSGYDIPYCMKLTKLGKTNRKSKRYGLDKAYGLELGTIPKECKHWIGNEE